MHKNKFIDLLKTFSAKELRLFTDLVESPFFNKDQQVVQLFHTIKRYAPNYTNKKLERTELYHTAFPNKNYNEKELGYFMSDLMRLGEQFMAQFELLSKPLILEEQKLNAFSRKGLVKHHNAVLKDADKLLKKRNFKHSDYYLNELQIELSSYTDAQRKNETYPSEKINYSVDLLDNFYLINKLKFINQLLLRRKTDLIKAQLISIQKIITDLEANFNQLSPIVKTYYLAFKAIAQADKENAYKNLKTAIDNNLNLMPKDEAREVYLYAINYAVKKVNKGDAAFQKELFHLYKNGIEKEILLNQNQLAVSTFKNMVSVALRVGAYDWVEGFIIHYKDFLPEEVQQNAYCFSMANLYYQKQMLEKASKTIDEVDKLDEHFDINIGQLKVKLAFEQNEKRKFNQTKDKWIHYLNKAKHLSKNNQAMQLSFVQKANQIFKATSTEQTELKQLFQELSTQRNIAERGWLRSRIKQKLEAATIQ